MKVKEFVEKFVGHNSIICIYNHKRVQTKDNGTHDEFVPLWKGMDWQVTENTDDMRYCKEHGYELCPHRNVEVVQIKNLPHGEFSDCIDIIIALSSWNEEEVRKETAKEILQRVVNICKNEEDFQDGKVNTQLEPLYFGIANGCAYVRGEVKEIAKEYGVEVEE